ncbi:MAG: PAS domain-containing protein [Bacteroidetes bacterium]|nr:PAS domain-containing protein [Bacteroidota bacterium]
METVNAMLAYWDAGLVCRFANKAYSDWFGISGEEMVGRITLQQLLGPQLFEMNLPYIRKALKGEQQTFERELRTPGGEVRNSLATYYPDVEDGKVRGLIVHVADTTPIRKMREIEAKLYESRELFQRFMDNSPTPAWIRDEEGIMQYMNTACMQAFELEGQNIGSPINELFPRELAEAYLKTSRQVLDSPGSVESVMKNTDRTQRSRTYKVIRFPLLYKGKKMIAGWLSDITEQVDALKQEEEKKHETLKLLIETQEAERGAISDRIHEDTMQTLSSCQLLLEDIAADGANVDVLKKANQNLRKAIKELNFTCEALSPTAILDVGLKDALKDSCRDLERRYHNKVRLHHFDVEIENFNALEKLNTFRIVSDLLTVLARYGDATRIELGAYYEKAALRLKVSYNGKAYAYIVDIPAIRNVRNRIAFCKGDLSFQQVGVSSWKIDIILHNPGG